jgi:hypothetical protein
MAKWLRANIILLTASSGFVTFVIIGLFSIYEWLNGEASYLKDGALALLFLSFGLVNLERWRQKQLRM